MSLPLVSSELPLKLWRRGKVREVYEVDDSRLLLVASDRVSAFDVVLDQPIPRKGQVLTQLAAFWFQRLSNITPSHFLTADTETILAEVPSLQPHRNQIDGRATLVRRTNPIAFECVVRGYLAGSAWKEYRESGTLAGEPLAEGLVNSSKLATTIFSPATKAEEGHDENISVRRMQTELGVDLTTRLRELSLALYETGNAIAMERGLIIADTKFEFGLDEKTKPILIDEILTPDSSRFWPADRYQPGRSQESFDKQPIRDWLDAERNAGRWDGNAPAPALPTEVIAASSERYLEAFRRITGAPLDGVDN